MNIRELRKGKPVKLPKNLKEGRASVLESDVQGPIVEYLKLGGYIVLQTNVSIRAGMAAAAREKGESVGYNATPGVPDLLVSRANWPHGCWLGLEVKPPQGRVRPEQEALRKAGRIFIVRSIADAMDAIDAFTPGRVENP